MQFGPYQANFMHLKANKIKVEKKNPPSTVLEHQQKGIPTMVWIVTQLRQNFIPI